MFEHWNAESVLLHKVGSLNFKTAHCSVKPITSFGNLKRVVNNKEIFPALLNKRRLFHDMFHYSFELFYLSEDTSSLIL